MSWLPRGFEFLAGLPEVVRRKWPLLTIHAYFDDSGAKGQGRWMAMSGLLGDADVFADLADEWRKHLAGPYPPGKIDYFKMDEAVSLNGQFHHWSVENRDAKVWQLSKLINRGDILQIGARIDLQAFAKMSERWNAEVTVQPTPGQKHHAMDEPYLQLFLCVFTTAITEAVANGAKSPIRHHLRPAGSIQANHLRFLSRDARTMGDRS